MDFVGTLSGFAQGLAIAADPSNVLYCLFGCLVGTLIGVLPGIGPAAAVALLLPLTFQVPPVGALIMLAGIYYGTQYGGSTSAILINLPGENSSVVTCLDGHQMARQGRAGPALAIAALGSLFAGLVATFFIAVFAPPLAGLALLFGPAEYSALMVLGLIAAIVMAQGSILKALGMIVLGLLLAAVGSDTQTGAIRMTLGIPQLFEGVGFIPLAMGLFGVGEIVKNLERPQDQAAITAKVSNLWPSRDDFRRCWKTVLRATGLGSVLGILPGGGHVLASFISYSLEKKIARNPARFGNGAPEGVAAPESANNAAAQTSFIPLLTLGIPSNAVVALLAGAMIMNGVQPGPDLINKHPEMFWGVIASMLVANVLLVIINLPLIGVWVQLLRIPYRLLYPMILVFMCIGVYAFNDSAFDVAQLIIFGFLGYAFKKWKCEPAPLLLAFVLGPLIEGNFRRAMLISSGDPMVFVTSPISLGLLVLALVLLVMTLLPSFSRTRRVAFQDEA